MKWKNRGHEFDKVFENIKKCTSVYLFGAGHDGEMVYHVLTKIYPGVEVMGFIDNDISKIGGHKCGLPILSLQQIEKRDSVGIVVSFASEFIKDIDDQLVKAGWESKISFWHFEEYLSVYAAYEYNKVYFSSICILPTTACNLRCKSCLNFTNYIKQFENRDIEKIKNEVDIYFKCVDYSGLFFISGGEPLLYPHLIELIDYIGENYRKRMYEFGMVTNGTICPTKELLERINKYNMKITIDDYRDSVPNKEIEINNTINIVCKNLDESNYSIRKYDEWISLYPHFVETLNENELIQKYNRCHCPWQEYRAGRLYSCDYASFADVACINSTDIETETFSLMDYKEKQIKELIEFRLGYTTKGYVEFCKICAGYMEINPYKVKAAEQEQI